MKRAGAAASALFRSDVLAWLAVRFRGRRKSASLHAMADRYRSFSEFWPFYLREHSRPRTRALHYAGTTLVVAILLFTLFTQRWWLLLAVPLAGYGFAWFAHFRIEKNRPATFKYPLWSLGADFRMWWLWLTGRLGRELERAGVDRS